MKISLFLFLLPVFLFSSACIKNQHKPVIHINQLSQEQEKTAPLEPFHETGSILLTEKDALILEESLIAEKHPQQSSPKILQEIPKEIPESKNRVKTPLNKEKISQEIKKPHHPVYLEKYLPASNPPLNEIIQKPVYSSNKKNLASVYLSSETQMRYMIINNRFYGPYEEVIFCGFNHDGSLFTFKFKKSGQWFFQTNEQIALPSQSIDSDKCYGIDSVLSKN